MGQLAKKFFSGVTLWKLTIQERRQRLLADKDVQHLLRAAHISGSMGESFDTFLKTII